MLYQRIDPDKILTSIQGIGPTIGPAITARVGKITDFQDLKALRSDCGFGPRKKQTSNTDRQGMKITKTANSLLKDYLYLAAETARHWDAEFAAFYDRLVHEQKNHHNKALAALANKMVGRIYAVLKRAADPRCKETTAYKPGLPPGNASGVFLSRKVFLPIMPRQAGGRLCRLAGH